MQFDFSDEQKALRDSLRRNLEKNCPIASVRAIIDSAAGHDAALWRNISEGGYLAAHRARRQLAMKPKYRV